MLTGWRRKAGALPARAPSVAVLALLAIALLPCSARAATAQDLSGVWLNSAYTLSAYELQMSADGQTLAATWNVNVGHVDEGLVGRFSGTLNASGTAFTGPMHVTVGSLSIGGTMTITLSSQQKHGYPLLDVSYLQDDGISGSMTLEMWLTPPKISSSQMAFNFYCPSSQPCTEEAEAQRLGGSSHRAKTVGSVRFTVAPGVARNIKLPLNKTGQRLLSQHHSLRVQMMVVALKKSATYLPLQTDLGTVTLHAK